MCETVSLKIQGQQQFLTEMAVSVLCTLRYFYGNGTRVVSYSCLQTDEFTWLIMTGFWTNEAFLC